MYDKIHYNKKKIKKKTKKKKKIYLSNKHLANTYYTPNMVLDTRDTSLKSYDLYPLVVDGLRGN